MISPQKTPKGHLESSKPFKTNNYDEKKMALIQTKSTPVHPPDYSKYDRHWNQQHPFEEAPSSKKSTYTYADHEIQRYSRNIDADEEGVRQEAQTSRLPSNVLAPAYSDGQRPQARDKHQIAENHKERYQRHLEKLAAHDKGLVQMPKSRVKTMNLGEREQMSQKKVKHATIAIASLIGSDGESTGGGPGSRMSNRSY